MLFAATEFVLDGKKGLLARPTPAYHEMIEVGYATIFTAWNMLAADSGWAGEDE